MFLFVCVFLVLVHKTLFALWIENCQFLLVLGHFFIFKVIDFYSKSSTLIKADSASYIKNILRTNAALKFLIYLPLKVKGLIVFYRNYLLFLTPATQYVFVGNQMTEQKNKQMDKGNSPQPQIISFE